MTETSNWIREYIPLAAALAAIFIAAFQYFTSRPKTKLEMVKLKKEIDALSDASSTNSDSISEIQNVLLEQLPMYQDEAVVYSNTSGNLGFDFTAQGGQIYEDGKPRTGKGSGSISYLEKGIISITRDNTDGRYELYLRSYTLDGRKTDSIPKDMTEDKPKRFRVSCEARVLNGEHVLRFVMRDRTANKWIGRSTTHRISSPEWKRVEAYFTIPPLREAELRIDDEQVSIAPSTIQIRKLLMTQRTSE